MLLERAQARCQKDRLEEQYLAVRIQTLSIHQTKRLSAALISLLERARGIFNGAVRDSDGGSKRRDGVI